MAQKNFNALLFDTRSIQRYIFSGNRLRTNVGASYIVDKVFFDVLIDGVLKKMFPDEKFPAGDDAWNPDNDNATPWTKMKSCCVAYIGGGNALLLFDSSAEKDLRVEVVKNFTRKLLVERPGLKVGAALGTLEVDDNGKLVQKTVDELYRELKSNQNKIFPAVNVPYSGLTLCEDNGETANYFGRLGIGDANFYSQETAVKSKLADEANENLRERFNEIFSRKGFNPEYNFKFPAEVDKLGQREGENYFAIVHVDGNNMGLKFRTCTGLDERRKLSREIRRKTEGAFADLLEKIIIMKRDNLFGDTLKFKADENFLPIRPLILGGDDVTFLCPANMAIMFTKTLIERLDADTPENSAEHLTEKISRHMDACAGIAILPTKYPFFRGYELAEQLCGEAKKEMRKLLPTGLDTKENLTAEDIPRGSSWLDFAILHGEQAPTLEQIRAKEYRGERGDLHFGPYLVCGDGDSVRKIENLIRCTEQFLVSKKKNPPPETMAHNKIKELRSVLQHGEDDAKKFLRQLRYQKQNLPLVSDWEIFSKNLWHEKKTPYVDAIELMDFYVEEVARAWRKLT